MAELEIVHYGNPILRKKGKPIEQFDRDLKRLAKGMIEVMHLAEGIGLAAQQVDLALRLCVVDLRAGERDFDYQLNASRLPLDLIMPLVLINPEVTAIPNPVTTASEGCLSFPEIQGEIDRPDRIEVRFKDLDGHDNQLTCNGLFSRCVQHEVDHLNGILFIDRMRKSSLLEIEQDLKQLKKTTRKRMKRRPGR
jgi:peptide deformylase